MKNINKKTFQTDSFQLASFLLSESFPIISIDRSNPRRIVFVFEESDKRIETTEMFLAHKTVVEPHKLYSAQRDIKQMIYDSKS